MEELKGLFFDTYAFFEIKVGNISYLPYIQENILIITTKLNLMELHYGLMLKYGKDEAGKTYNELKKFAVEIDDETIFNANEFRLINKQKNMSYVDCIGYSISKKLGVKFLTGDKAFEGLENVEFVK